MRIKDTIGTHWEVTRRTRPWRRVFRPVDLAFADYCRYRVTPESPAKRARRERARERQRQREATKRRRDEASELRLKERRRRFQAASWWGKSWRVVAAVPYALWLIFVELLREGVEHLVSVVTLALRALVGLVTLPVAVVEALAQAVGFAVLAAMRGMGIARHRIDVVGTVQRRIVSLSVLKVPGKARATELVGELGEAARRCGGVFNPRRGEWAGAEVSFHDSETVRLADSAPVESAHPHA